LQRTNEYNANMLTNINTHLLLTILRCMHFQVFKDESEKIEKIEAVEFGIIAI
jgi:hypothetical protein